MIASLIHRNLRLFFRDRAGVFFSLLGPLIMFLLYIFFLGNLQKDTLREAFPDGSPEYTDFFINSWLFAGILSITTVTTSLAAMQVFVSDRASGRFKDFTVSPIKRSKIIIGYLGSTFIVSLLMTSILFILSELYIVANGGLWLTLERALLSYVVLVLLCAVFSAFASFLVTFIRSISAFTSLSVIIGTSTGFLAAIYVPVGALPTTVTNVINTLPFSQAAGLLRGSYVGQAAFSLPFPAVTEKVTTDDVESAGNFFAENSKPNTPPVSSDQFFNVYEFYGLSLKIGSHELSWRIITIILSGLSACFAAAAIWRIDKRLK